MRLQTFFASAWVRLMASAVTDNGQEFTAAEFADYCADDGSTRHNSTPYSPQQNGVVEWRNQTVVAMERALLKQRVAFRRSSGRGGGDSSPSTEPIGDQELEGQNPVRSMA